jgi:DNA-binding NarL/FixJ family response regulator
MSQVRVAVLAEVPLYRAGLSAVLSRAGYVVETPTDVVDWVRGHGLRGERTAVIATARPGTLCATLEGLSGFHSVALVVLVHAVEPSVCLSAIAAGATSALSWATEEGDLLRAVEAALVGHAILPTEVVRSLMSARGHWIVSDQQLNCLRRLADGATVSSIAQELHYSDREMFRRLRALYRNLGATGRQDAVTRAVERGIIEGPAARQGQS